MIVALELAFGLLVGLLMGLLGAGGSILTVPALVYGLGQPPQTAVTTSLAIVAANSLMGASMHRVQGTLNWRVALIFGGVGMLFSFLTSGFSKLLPASVLMSAFALLMLAAGVSMLTRNASVTADAPPSPWWVWLAGGAGVGALTGILGVGGGFIIVPALVMGVGLPMQTAVGTSLMIIAMNSLAGLAGHWSAGVLDPLLLAVFLLSGLAGTFAGARLASRVPSAQLQKLFAWFIILLALFLLADNLTKLFS